MIKIMVMGAGGTAGINFISSLRMSGNAYYIVGCDINEYHLHLLNDLCDKTYNVPTCNSNEYLNVINRIIEDESIDFIHAQPDIEVESLVKLRDQHLLKAKTFLPDNLTIEICRDKARTNVILNQNFLNVPLSIPIFEDYDIEKSFQFIQKKSEKVWVRATKGAGSKAALPVTSLRQAIDWINYWIETKRLETTDFMLCEFLPGKEYAFQSLWYNGELLMSACRERIEYFMGNLFPSGQSSSPSVAKSVYNEKVNNLAYKAIKTIDNKASGIFCVDIKENSIGEPCITEINAGRFFTTSNFFATIGSNMPDYYIQLGMIMNRKNFNDVPEGKFWVRGADCLPICYEDKICE